MKYTADALTKKVKRQIVDSIRVAAISNDHENAADCELCQLVYNMTDCDRCNWCIDFIMPLIGTSGTCDNYRPSAGSLLLGETQGGINDNRCSTLEDHPKWFAAKRRHLMRRARVLEKRWGLK